MAFLPWYGLLDVRELFAFSLLYGGFFGGRSGRGFVNGTHGMLIVIRILCFADNSPELVRRSVPRKIAACKSYQVVVAYFRLAFIGTFSSAAFVEL